MSEQPVRPKSAVVELVGWYGTAAIVGAYALVSMDAVEPDSTAYQLLNLTGAIGIIVVAAWNRVMQPVVLNVVWALVATVALIRIAL